MNIALWIMQVLLAAAFTAAGGMKVFAYAKYKAMSEKNGPSGLNHGLVTFIGLSELAGVCTDAWPNSSWICSNSAPAALHIFAHERRRSWGAIPGTPAAAAYPWSNCQTTFSLKPTPRAWPARFTGRKT
jgi:DoxX-like family